MVTQVAGEVEVVRENEVLRAFKAVDLVVERRMVTLEWVASPVNDMYADAVLCAVLQAESMDPPAMKVSNWPKVRNPILYFWPNLNRKRNAVFETESKPKVNGKY